MPAICVVVRSWRRIGLSVGCALALGALVGSGAAAAGNSPNPTGSSAKSTPSAGRGAPTSERGVVQSVSADRLVLKALDGSMIVVAIDARTRVLIDGKSASIFDVRPGFVAVVTTRGASGQAALEVDAFTTSSGPAAPVVTAAGVVRSVSPGRLVLASLEGRILTVVIDAAARVYLDGKPASLVAVRAGFVAVVIRSQGGKQGGKGGKNRGPQEVFAFAPPPQGARLYRGVVASVTVRTVVLRSRSGSQVRIRVIPSTRVFVNGIPGSIRQVEPGFVAVVRTGPRHELWAFSAP
jgi:hypothetical protein